MSADAKERDNLQQCLKLIRICRFCLSSGRLTNIFAKDAKISSLAPLPVQIMACASIEVFTNDGMPGFVCEPCRNLFEHSYRFKQMCKRADTLLRQYPLTGEIPKPLDRPKLSQTLNSASTSVLTPTTTSTPLKTTLTVKQKSNSLPKIQTIYASNVNGPIKILNSDPSDSPEPPVPTPMRSVKKEPNNDMMENLLNKVGNDEDISMEDIQCIIAGESDQNFLIESDNSNVVKSPPKVLNKSSKRILNKGINEKPEPQLSQPEIKLKDNGDVEIVAAIIEPIFSNQEKPKNKVIEAAPVATNVYPCPHCERTFALLQLRDIHIITHNRERNFHCAECDKAFFSKYDLQKHSVRHTGEKPYKCTVCEKGFSRATLLHRHENIHTDVPKFLCVYCEKTFISRRELEKHVKRHEKERPFKCKTCNKGFAFKQGLERHEVVHNAVLPYPCQYCEQTFSTPSKLARHLTAHAGKRPYLCKYCPKNFLLSHHLSRHMRSHKESSGKYTCVECGKAFANRDDLVFHSAVHSTTLMKCVLCQLQFETSQEVVDHIKLHTAGEAYACEFCDLIFLRPEDLLPHYKSSHPEEVGTYQIQDLVVVEKPPIKKNKLPARGKPVNSKKIIDDDHLIAKVNEIFVYDDEDDDDDEENDVENDETAKEVDGEWEPLSEKPKILNQFVLSTANENEANTQNDITIETESSTSSSLSQAKKRRILTVDGVLNVVEGENENSKSSSSPPQKRKIPQSKIEEEEFISLPKKGVNANKPNKLSLKSKSLAATATTTTKAQTTPTTTTTSTPTQKSTTSTTNEKKLTTPAEVKAALARLKESKNSNTLPAEKKTTRQTIGKVQLKSTTVSKDGETSTTTTATPPQQRPVRVKQIRMSKNQTDELKKQGRIKFTNGNMILTKPSPTKKGK